MTRKYGLLTAKKLKNEIKRQNLQIADLAKKSNISEFTVKNILNGKSRNIDALLALSKTLGVPLEAFFESQENSYDANLHKKIIAMINNISKQRNITLDIEKVNQLVKFIYPRLKATGDQGKIAEIYVKAAIDAIESNNLNFDT